MSGRTLHVVVPGDIDTMTGGYGYDRRIIHGLRSRGWHVVLHSLPGQYPLPTPAERAAAGAALATIPVDSVVLVDGLAFGALPDEAAVERHRLYLLALVHHPLGLETGLSTARSHLLLASERRALESVRGVVVTSPRTAEAVASLGVPPSRIAVVEPGTDAAAESRGSGGVGARRLLTVASLTPRKGHDTLLDALEGMLDLDWHLTCVGSVERDSMHASRLANRAATAPLHGRVTLAGELAGEALEAAYAAADVFVLPTRYEGYGMSVAEAVAHALPVVSTATGGIPELVGRAGVLVPPDDEVALRSALRALLTDAALFGQLRDEARAARAALPSWDAACERMEAALTALAAS